MLIRIKPLNDSMEKEVFIPQECITAIRKVKLDWNDDEIAYEIVVSNRLFVIDKNAYEKLVNEFITLDTETGVSKWEFFGNKDAKERDVKNVQ